MKNIIGDGYLHKNTLSPGELGTAGRDPCLPWKISTKIPYSTPAHYPRKGSFPRPSPSPLLTLEWVNTDGLPLSQRVLHILLLHALNAQVLERHRHRLHVQVDRADALLAAILADQVVRVGPVRRVFGDAGDDDHGGAAVADHLDAGEGLAVGGGVGARDAARRATLTLVPEAQRLRGGLLSDDHFGLPPAGRTNTEVRDMEMRREIGTWKMKREAEGEKRDDGWGGGGD